MHELHELKNRLCDELEKYSAEKFSAGNLEVIDKLAHAIKNIDKIIEMGEGEYSGDMMRPGGVVYARGRRNAKRDAMGRYSSERMPDRMHEPGYSRDGEELARQIRDLMDDAPDEHIRRDMERLLRKVEQM